MIDFTTFVCSSYRHISANL